MYIFPCSLPFPDTANAAFLWTRWTHNCVLGYKSFPPSWLMQSQSHMWAMKRQPQNCSHQCTQKWQHNLPTPAHILASKHHCWMPLTAASWANRTSRSRQSLLQVFFAKYCAQLHYCSSHWGSETGVKICFPAKAELRFSILRCFRLSKTSSFW